MISNFKLKKTAAAAAVLISSLVIGHRSFLFADPPSGVSALPVLSTGSNTMSGTYGGNPVFTGTITLASGATLSGFPVAGSNVSITSGTISLPSILTAGIAAGYERLVNLSGTGYDSSSALSFDESVNGYFASGTLGIGNLLLTKSNSGTAILASGSEVITNGSYATLYAGTSGSSGTAGIVSFGGIQTGTATWSGTTSGTVGIGSLNISGSVATGSNITNSGTSPAGLMTMGVFAQEMLKQRFVVMQPRDFTTEQSGSGAAANGGTWLNISSGSQANGYAGAYYQFVVNGASRGVNQSFDFSQPGWDSCIFTPNSAIQFSGQVAPHEIYANTTINASPTAAAIGWARTYNNGSSDNIVAMNYDTSAHISSPLATISSGQLHCVVMHWDGAGNVAYYVDGTAVGTGTGAYHAGIVGNVSVVSGITQTSAGANSGLLYLGNEILWLPINTQY
jgi:hypothetical protein